MFGLLRKLNFSQEKLSLYSLILALETTGISSPDTVPAKKKKQKPTITITYDVLIQDIRTGISSYTYREFMKTLTLVSKDHEQNIKLIEAT